MNKFNPAHNCSFNNIVRRSMFFCDLFDPTCLLLFMYFEPIFWFVIYIPAFYSLKIHSMSSFTICYPITACTCGTYPHTTDAILISILFSFNIRSPNLERVRENRVTTGITRFMRRQKMPAPRRWKSFFRWYNLVILLFMHRKRMSRRQSLMIYYYELHLHICTISKSNTVNYTPPMSSGASHVDAHEKRWSRSMILKAMCHCIRRFMVATSKQSNCV